MSNRIDLTQFEGITPTQWRVDYEAVGDTKTVLYVKSDWTAHGNFVIAVLEDAPDGKYTEADANAIAAVPDLLAELKRCYEVMNEVILRAMDAREEEVSDIIKHGDEEYVHVDEITYPFSKSDIDAALDSKASE